MDESLGPKPCSAPLELAAKEARLGVELLRRTTRRQSLTAAGEAYLGRCRIILAEMEDAEALVHDLGATARGRLRVGAPGGFGALCLAPVIRAFAARWHDIDVELVLDDRYVDLVEERLDAVVRLGSLKDSALLSCKLAPHRLIACAAPADLASHGRPDNPTDLAARVPGVPLLDRPAAFLLCCEVAFPLRLRALASPI